jgi:hypothetical protein
MATLAANAGRRRGTDIDPSLPHRNYAADGAQIRVTGDFRKWRA